MRGLLILSFLAAACSEPAAPTAPAADVAQQDAPLDPDAWWTAATQRDSGQERVLAPRELRALLADGEARGFTRNAPWWSERVAWTYKRILEVDPADPEANAGVGNKSLQDVPGFRETWEKMLSADPTEQISGLLDAYEVQVTGGRPVYLDEEEFAILSQRFRKVREHLTRVDTDPEYVALQRALREVRRGALSDFPFVYVRRGPFLVFFTARDLQKVPGEDETAESKRIAARSAFYEKALESWVDVYLDVVKEVQKAHPAVWARKKPGAGDLFCQWVFGEREWYATFQERVRKEGAEAPYRCGFHHSATGWAYLYDPVITEQKTPGLEPEAVRRESAAYLAAVQLLRHWGRDPNDPTTNHLDRSRAYWFKEGWPSFVAARTVQKPIVGRVFVNKWTLPPIRDVIQRRSKLDRTAFLQPPEDAGWDGQGPEDGGYTDLARHVVDWLHEHKKAALDRFLISQVQGDKRGIEWFEECFKVGPGGWEVLERGAYAPLR